VQHGTAQTRVGHEEHVMIRTGPQPWDDDRDNAFFRMTADVFSPDFLAGASALLASYDPEVTLTLRRVTATGAATPGQPRLALALRR
jgi:hypothetical protein